MPTLGDRQLIIQDVRISEAGVFLAARLVGEMTGREYFYDWLRNTLEFSVTRLVVGGNFIGYNQVFLNAEIGPMVEIGQVASMLGFAVDEGTNGRVRVAGTDLVGLTFGQQTFVCLRELRKLPITAVWEAASGLLTINHRR